MRTQLTTAGKVWKASAPGAWQLDAAHFPSPLTPYFGEILVEQFPIGFAEGSARIGLLLSHFDHEVSNGFDYLTPRVVGAPKSAKGPPPYPIFKLLTWFHPALRARLAAAATAFERKPWREDLRLWQQEIRPRSTATHLAFEDCDPRSPMTRRATEAKSRRWLVCRDMACRSRGVALSITRRSRVRPETRADSKSSQPRSFKRCQVQSLCARPRSAKTARVRASRASTRHASTCEVPSRSRGRSSTARGPGAVRASSPTERASASVWPCAWASSCRSSSRPSWPAYCSRAIPPTAPMSA